MNSFAFALVALTGLAYVCGSPCGGSCPVVPQPCSSCGGGGGGITETGFYGFSYTESMTVAEFLSGFNEYFTSQYNEALTAYKSASISESSASYQAYQAYGQSIQDYYGQFNSYWTQQIANVNQLGNTDLLTYIKNLETELSFMSEFASMLQKDYYTNIISGGSSVSINQTKSTESTSVSANGGGVGIVGTPSSVLPAPVGGLPAPVGGLPAPGGGPLYVSIWDLQVTLEEIKNGGPGVWDAKLRGTFPELQRMVEAMQSWPEMPQSSPYYADYTKCYQAVVAAFQEFGTNCMSPFLTEYQANWEQWKTLQDAELIAAIQKLVDKYHWQTSWSVFKEYYEMMSSNFESWKSGCVVVAGGGSGGSSGGSYSSSASYSSKSVSEQQYSEQESSTYVA